MSDRLKHNLWPQLRRSQDIEYRFVNKHMISATSARIMITISIPNAISDTEGFGCVSEPDSIAMASALMPRN